MKIDVHFSFAPFPVCALSLIVWDFIPLDTWDSELAFDSRELSATRRWTFSSFLYGCEMFAHVSDREIERLKFNSHEMSIIVNVHQPVRCITVESPSRASTSIHEYHQLRSNYDVLWTHSWMWKNSLWSANGKVFSAHACWLMETRSFFLSFCASTWKFGRKLS